MSILYGLNYFVDVLLYFAILGCVGLLAGTSDRLFFIPVILFAACTLCHLLSGKKNEKLRFLPLALFIPCMLLARGWGERILCVAPSVYLCFYLKNNRGLADYYYVARKFRSAMVGLCAVLFFVAISPAHSWGKGLLFLFLYLTLIIYLLRMLRHDDKTVKSTRFKLMNLTGVGAVCAAGFGLSRPAVVAVLARIWALFRDVVLARVLSLLLWLVELVLYGFNLLVGWLFPYRPIEMSYGEIPVMEMEGDMETVMAAMEENTVNPVVRAIVIGIGALLAGAILIALVRLLSRQTARMGTANEDDERENLTEAEAAPRPGRLRRRDPEDGVRWYYLRALQSLRAKGGTVTQYMNTEQIRDENAELTDLAAMNRLREIYLPARYGEQTPSPADVQAAREASEQIRRRAAAKPKRSAGT